jgi:hypothetical protein
VTGLARQAVNEIAFRAKPQLQHPRPPAELRGYVVALMDVLESTNLFVRSGLTFIQEAHIAAEMGILREASAACLVSDDRPDFELLFEDRTEFYELVEAHRLNRNRGDEYKALEAAGFPIYELPIEEWATPEQAFLSIRAMAEKKAKRAEKLAARGTPYPKETRLLFYVNLVDFGAHQKEIEAVFSSAAEPARLWFSSIWVLWKNRIYQV